MNKPHRFWSLIVLCCLFALPSAVQANGTETLGPPVGLALNSGTTMAVGGTGLKAA